MKSKLESTITKQITNTFYTMCIVILFLGPYTLPMSLSHIVPYAMFFLIIKKIKIIEVRVLHFIFFYLSGIVFIIAFSIDNRIDLLNIIALMDNFLRVIPLMLLGYYLRNKYNLKKVIYFIITITFILCIIQVFFEKEIIVPIYLILYMEPTKALQQVAMGRAIATFAFPADLGYFSLLCIIYCLLNANDTNRNRDKLDILFLFVSIFIGILSASKTFIYGTILLILYYSFYKRQRIIDILNIAVVITLVFYFGLLIYKHNEEFRTIVDWQLENAMNIERSYQLRYEGATKEMSIQIIKYFPYGKGILPINDVFVGDSGFLSYLFYGGVFSLSLFYIANVILMSKNKYLFALFLVAFFVELGRPAFFASRAADLFWLISGLFLRNDSSCAYK